MKAYNHINKIPLNLLNLPKKWKKKEEYYIKKANSVIVVTKNAKNEIIKRINVSGNKIFIVPNTVRKEFYENINLKKCLNENLKKDFKILYIGDTGERRGLLTAIQGVNILQKKYSFIKLLIVGKSTFDIKLKNFVG
ncbi:MAG: glycosyltransferase family 1 protein, partial [Lutibacter sp.]